MLRITEDRLFELMDETVFGMAKEAFCERFPAQINQMVYNLRVIENERIPLTLERVVTQQAKLTEKVDGHDEDIKTLQEGHQTLQEGQQATNDRLGSLEGMISAPSPKKIIRPGEIPITKKGDKCSNCLKSLRKQGKVCNAHVGKFEVQGLGEGAVFHEIWTDIRYLKGVEGLDD